MVWIVNFHFNFKACEDLPVRKAGSDPQVIGVNKVSKEFLELREKMGKLSLVTITIE